MILSADRNRVSPPEYNCIANINVDIPIVLVTRLDGYVFNTELEKLKEYVLVDMVEYNWDWNMERTHLFGQNTNYFADKFDYIEWLKFDNFVKWNPPKIYFKRELLKQDVNPTVKPIEYPCYANPYPIESKDDFNNRRIEVMNYWGFSHPIRKKFQGESHIHSLKGDITVIDNLYYLDGFLNENHKRYWVSVHIPHFARIPIEHIYGVNGKSKLSLSLPGAGNKCFRHSESPVNSVMVMQDNDIAWTHEWVHNQNCIKFKGENIVDAIEEAMNNPNLYEIYLEGLKTVDKYRSQNYTQYIETIINNA